MEFKADFNNKNYDLSNKIQREAYWSDYATHNLVGKKIVNVRYMSTSEAEHMGWYSRSLVIQFDDGTIIYPSKDDEGNDAGALFGKKNKTEMTFPVL
jgi:hypothetical protein